MVAIIEYLAERCERVGNIHKVKGGAVRVGWGHPLCIQDARQPPRPPPVNVLVGIWYTITLCMGIILYVYTVHGGGARSYS